MGAFEDSIPEKIAEVEKKMKAKWLERADINWGHDCDCEFCDKSGEEPDPEAEKIAEEIDAFVNECKNTIKRLKTHAELHGVKL